LAPRRDPKKRATAAEILAHEWVKADGVASDEPLEPEVLKRMRGFAAMNKLKKEALKVSRGAGGLLGGSRGAAGAEGRRAGVAAPWVASPGVCWIAGLDLAAASGQGPGASRATHPPTHLPHTHTHWRHARAPPQIIACNLPPAEIEGLKALFKTMDNDNSGTITVEEMKNGLRKKDSLIPEVRSPRASRARTHARFWPACTPACTPCVPTYLPAAAAAAAAAPPLVQAWGGAGVPLPAGFCCLAAALQGVPPHPLPACLPPAPPSPQSELARIMELADLDGDGNIDYEEFLAATVHAGVCEGAEGRGRAGP
jgi:hypothetical protein